MKNKKVMLYISLAFLSASMILNFPFPHKYTYGEGIFMALNIPISFANGFHTVGIMTLFLLAIGLYLLAKSLKKYQGRIVFVVIIIVIFAPTFIVSSYQKTFATGIYAVSHINKESNCSFETISEKTLHGECELAFKNYSNNAVQFTIEFNDDPRFKDGLAMVSLMNNNGPYEVTIEAQEIKHIYIKTDIDASNMENPIHSGSAQVVNIIMKSKNKSRIRNL